MILTNICHRQNWKKPFTKRNYCKRIYTMAHLIIYQSNIHGKLILTNICHQQNGKKPFTKRNYWKRSYTITHFVRLSVITVSLEFYWTTIWGCYWKNIGQNLYNAMNREVNYTGTQSLKKNVFLLVGLITVGTVYKYWFIGSSRISLNYIGDLKGEDNGR